uniref:Ovule protein n=1 Tax=Schistosoma mansoni TaxID=6183 RepID=A0A5K4F751_SCHMA
MESDRGLLKVCYCLVKFYNQTFCFLFSCHRSCYRLRIVKNASTFQPEIIWIPAKLVWIK